jgi:pSer/pThr/pTyr-binding forkhead associated (FHA) protein
MTATTCITTRTHGAVHAASWLGAGPALELDDHTFLPLDRAVMRIGRGFAADVRLDDHTVSYRHAVLVDTSVGVVLLDDRSIDGTYVNGERTTRALLAPGDEIRLGRVTMRYAA